MNKRIIAENKLTGTPYTEVEQYRTNPGLSVAKTADGKQGNVVLTKNIRYLDKAVQIGTIERNFTIFEKHGSNPVPFLTVFKKSGIYLSAAAKELVNAERVEVLIDRMTKSMLLQPSTSPNAYHLQSASAGRGAYLSAPLNEVMPLGRYYLEQEGELVFVHHMADTA